MKTLFIFLLVLGLAGITASAALADDWMDGSLWGWSTMMCLFFFASPSLAKSIKRIGTGTTNVAVVNFHRQYIVPLAKQGGRIIGEWLRCILTSAIGGCARGDGSCR